MLYFTWENCTVLFFSFRVKSAGVSSVSVYVGPWGWNWDSNSHSQALLKARNRQPFWKLWQMCLIFLWKDFGFIYYSDSGSVHTLISSWVNDVSDVMLEMVCSETVTWTHLCEFFDFVNFSSPPMFIDDFKLWITKIKRSDQRFGKRWWCLVQN